MRRFVRWDSVRVRRGWVCLDLRLTFFCIFLFVVLFLPALVVMANNQRMSEVSIPECAMARMDLLLFSGVCAGHAYSAPAFSRAAFTAANSVNLRVVAPIIGSIPSSPFSNARR